MECVASFEVEALRAEPEMAASWRILRHGEALGRSYASCMQRLCKGYGQ